MRTKGYEACSGCSLCLLACPVWHATRDIRLTPHGRSKALQHGVAVSELAESMGSCTLCGACEPACPEDMALVDMVLDLRARLGRGAVHAPAGIQHAGEGRATAAAVQIIPDRALADKAELLMHVGKLLNADVAADDGADIATALEAGAKVPVERMERFLASLRGAQRLIIGDGLLYRKLGECLPSVRRESLGAALSGMDVLAGKLSRKDFYVIEPRVYHADRERLVGHYDGLRRRTGCSMNLDLQRLAVPTTAGSLASVSGASRVDVQEQARWMLEGCEFERIVVEDLNDVGVFSTVAGVPVVHIAELMES